MKAVLLALLCLTVVAGCRGGKGGKKPPKPSPSPSPFAYEAQIDRPEAVIPDHKGGRIALLRGLSGTVGAGFHETPRATLTGTQAILYRDNKPALQIDAPTIVADAAAGTLVATGSVTARSLGDGPTTTLRSDTMTWRAARNLLTGTGDVLLTQGDTVQVPAQRFAADTRLSRVEFVFGDTPALGKL